MNGISPAMGLSARASGAKSPAGAVEAPAGTGRGRDEPGVVRSGGRDVNATSIGRPEPGARVPERGSGFGSESRRNALASNFEDPANVSSPGRTGEAVASEPLDGLTDAEREAVEKLRARDAEVRRHEQAHAAVGGRYASAPSYTFQKGPDGKRYAIGGEVRIDVATVPGDPEATIRKMGIVKAAALAPAEPSAADRRVAALADAQRLEAMSDLSSKRAAERLADFEKRNTPPAPDSAETGGIAPDPATDRFKGSLDFLRRGVGAGLGDTLNIAA